MRKILLLLLTAGLLFSACEKTTMKEGMGSLVPQTVDQDPTLPSVKINGALLHAEAFGNPNDPLIICLHGGPGGDYRYLLFSKELINDGYRVVFYDQRGSGLSQRFPAKWYTSLGSEAFDKMFYDDLRGIIQYYKTSPTQKVILLTQSWGSMLGTAYAGKYPNEIDGLILAEPGGYIWDDVKEYVTKSRSFKLLGETLNDATFADQIFSAKEDDHDMLDYKWQLLSSSNEIVGDYIHDERSWRSGSVMSAEAFELGEKFKPDFSAGIEQLRIPVLFMYSENNKAYGTAWAEKISADFKHKQLEKINGVGHSGMFTIHDTWRNVTKPMILTYLKKL